MISYIIKDKSTRLFIILGGFFIANTLIAEVIGVKIFSLEDSLGLRKADFSLLGESHLSFNLTVGVLPWPVVFIMTDIINEYYGVKGVRFLSILTAGLIAFMFVLFLLAIRLVPSDFWVHSYSKQGLPDMQAAYSAIIGQGMNIIVGSITAFLLGQIADAFVFRKIKIMTGEKRIWARATVSTLVSQLIDSFVVIFIAFYLYQDWSLGRVFALALTAYAYKFIIALLCTPIVYGIHWGAERYLGKDLAAQMKQAALAKGD